jgi:hypothetical protein
VRKLEKIKKASLLWPLPRGGQSRCMRTMAAILLLTLPAAAEVPGGRVYFGAGAL